MSRHDDLPRLKDMLAHADEAVKLCRGRTREDLARDLIFSLALVRLLEIVGEAAARVSPPIRSRYPGIDWTGIVGLRNRLMHGYGDVDCDIVWDIVQGDLPELVRHLSRSLDEP
jgi:uncharacterized protein with HEPN domain